MIKKGDEVLWSDPVSRRCGAGIIKTVHRDGTITLEAGTYYPSVRIPITWVITDD